MVQEFIWNKLRFGFDKMTQKTGPKQEVISIS